MKLSTRSTYGMRALVEIGLAKGRGPLSASSIASRQGLSVAYLEQLLHRLKKRGLVHSIRGPKGGYLLAKDPERITVSQIVDSLEGLLPLPGLPAPRASRQAGNGKGKPAFRPAQRLAQTVLRRVREHMTQSLDQLTLKDLCEDVRDASDEPLDHRYVFHI
jgi:Rrf2 family protein